MAIILNDNIKINAGKPSESKYLNSSNIAYSATTEAISAIPISERYLGLTVLVDTGITNVEYWWREGVQDVDLIEKKFASQQLVGDFITGATNLGYFEGTNSIQWLDISGTGFGVDAGNYYSNYNWYYVDKAPDLGEIKLGSPTHNGPLRRPYINAARTKSWVWDESSGEWNIIQGDVTTQLGNIANINSHTGYSFTGITWSGSSGVASASVTAYGNLDTGTTITIGNPIYSDKANQTLNFRTPISNTPAFLKIETDDYYVRFSGVSSVINGSNLGSGAQVFKQKTGTTLQHRTLVGSGDTTVVQTPNEIRIYSVGGTGTMTVDNVGVGGGLVYRDVTGTTVNVRTIKGSGSTSVITVGNEIVVDSSGGMELFTDDIIVSIDAGKTFGKYENGDTIPASGLTANEVIILACFEAKNPTVNLSSSGNNVTFGESGKTVNLNFSYTINTLGASVSGTTLEWRRGGIGVWTGLTITTGDTTYNHNIDDTANRFNTDILNYRYTVTDSAGASATATHNVTPQAYAAPTMALSLGGTVISPETQTSREKGNVISNPSGSINSNRLLVDITDWTLERQYDGGGYIVLASGTSLSTSGVTISATLDNTIPTTATTINYRITYVDEYNSGNGGAQSIIFNYFSHWGYNTGTSLTSGQVIALANKNFLASRAMTDTFTAALLEYTYYSYPASYGAITSIILDGVTPILGAFTEINSALSVTNSYGESLNYRVYKSNLPGAFTANSVAFS